VLFPLLLGYIFNAKVSLGFTSGATFVGFFLACTTSMTAGILESAKEWVFANK
jgi:hypothetical protein